MSKPNEQSHEQELSGSAIIKMLGENGKWARMMAISMYVLAGLALLAGIVFVIMSMDTYARGYRKDGVAMAVVGVFNIVAAVLPFRGIGKLMNFVKAIEAANRDESDAGAYVALEFLQDFFKFFALSLLALLGTFVVMAMVIPIVMS